jgi:RND superfamily putative drug exporter
MKHGIWGPIAKLVVNKPGISGGIVAILLVATALNVFNLDYEFDTAKKFPEELPSRVGYEIVEARYDKGELAPTTLLLASDKGLTRDDATAVSRRLEMYDEVASVRLIAQSEDSKAMKLSIALSMNPYATESIDFMKSLREEAPGILEKLSIVGEAHFSGVTAKLVDERNVNDRDIVKIVILESLLILALLFALTRSFKMPIYMMATILLSYLSALGLGVFLVEVLFGYEAVSTRVPIYAFIFLVALGIDYNIILASRFIEERGTKRVKDALEIAIRSTGGVISSAGVILAATFAALTTMPIADLFIFGFIVAVGILIDTFLVRGMLLPALILLFEKDKQTSHN